MSCRVENLTHTEVVQKVLNGTKIFTKFENQTQEESIKKLELISNLAESKPISNTELDKKVYRNPSGITEKYIDPVTGKLIAQKRITDAPSMKFLLSKGAEAANEINQRPDNILKAWAGNVVHAASQDILERMIEKETTGLIQKNPKKTLSHEEIKDKHELSEDVAKNLETVIAEQVRFIRNTQKAIDPNGKAKVFTEQLILKQGNSTATNLMGRGDVIIVFSDNTGGYLDYKTITPKGDSTYFNPISGTYEVASDDWISQEKMEDFNLQLPTIAKILTDEIGLDKMRFARVIPMAIQLESKKKTDRVPNASLQKKIKRVQTMGDYFESIPIILEQTNIASLDASIAKLTDLKNNLEQRLKTLTGKERDDMKHRISQITRSLKLLIVKKDMKYMLNDFYKLVSRYTDSLGTLKDLDNPQSEAFLSLKQLNDLINDVHIYQGVVASAPEFYKGLGLKEEELKESIDQVYILTGRLNTLHSQLTEKQIQRTLTKEEQTAAQNAHGEGFVGRLFKSLSQINHPLFQLLNKDITDSNDKTRLSMQAFYKKLKAKMMDLEKWGSNNGFRGMSVYEKLIDKTTGALHSEYSKDFWTTINKLSKEENTAELKKLFELKSNAKELFEEQKKEFILRNSINTEDYRDGKKLDAWVEYNSPEKKALFNKNRWKYYDLKEEIKNLESNKTEAFKYIQSNKELLDFYRFWGDSMLEARKLLGYHDDEELIRPNFIPWIRKESIEMLASDGMPSLEAITDKFSEIWTIEPDETRYGQMVSKEETLAETGQTRRQVPRFFTQPFMNSEGKIDSTMKSYDLSSSLMMFMHMAYNYNNLSQVEAHVNAMQDLIFTPEFGEIEKDSHGNPVLKPSQTLKKLFGHSTNMGELYNKMVDAHLYGIHIQDTKEFGKYGQTLLNLKKYQITKELMLAPLVASTNYLGIRAQMYFEGNKGFFYKGKDMAETSLYHKKALIPGSKEEKQWTAVTKFLEPYGDNRTHWRANELKVSSLMKYANSNYLMRTFGGVEEHAADNILISMMKNYGVSENGNIRRLSTLPEGAKSLWEGTKVDGDNLIIPGIINGSEVNQKAYTQFRNTVLSAARNIKGSMSQEDTYAMHMSLMGNLMMSFKTWMPGLAYERFGGIQWDKTLGVIKSGRYSTALGEVFNNSDDAGVTVLLMRTAKRLSQFSLEMATFGGLNLKVNQERAQKLFDEYLTKNPHLLTEDRTREELFQEFVEYRQGQVRAMAAELRSILLLVSFMLFLGSGVGKNWYERSALRQVNWVRRELDFFLNPKDWLSLVKYAIPVQGIATDVAKLASKIGKTTDNLIEGKHLKANELPVSNYALHMIPGYRMVTFFEPYKPLEKNPY